MTATDAGRRAETAAADYLVAHGFTVIQRNYRTPRCEIDIIARAGDRLYFIEVKYRATARQGSGLEYITPAKQAQMHFAAEQWLTEHAWRGEVTLGAIEVSGPDDAVTAFIDAIAW